MGIEATQAERGTLMEAALAYAAYGWACFPCKPNKKPFTEHGFENASTNPDAIMGWWRKWPSAAIGIACEASGIAVLEYDPYHDLEGAGLPRLDALTAGPETRQARSGSGGIHYYYQATHLRIRNTTKSIAPGVDTRGDGGYIIAPPSRNENGQYHWLNRVDLQPLPERVYQAWLETKSREAPTVIDSNGHIPEGRRNETLTSLAGTLWRRGMSPLAVEQALLIENQEHCAPPLEDDEVRAIVRSIGRYPAGDLSVGTVSDTPAAELVGSDSVRVALTLGNGTGAAFTFSEMEKDRRELAAHLSLAFTGLTTPYQQRINLESSSQRTELRRELDNLYGKDYNWAGALNAVWSLARETFLSQDRSTRFSDIPLLIGARDLVPPLLPAEGATVFFGDGSSSKSYLGLGLCIAGCTQTPFAGRYAVPDSPVLYLDYEDSDTNFRRRGNRVLSGLGLQSQSLADLHYWRGRGIPLKDQWEAIRRACDRNGIGWLVIDSAVPACSGPPEEAQAAQGLFMAIERIGRPVLIIAHIPKSGGSDATQKPFGSTFFSNLARRTWFVARTEREDSDQIHVALHCRKVNDGPKPRPLGFQVTFSGDEGPVTFEPYDPGQDPELVRHGSAQSQIWSVLDKPLTVNDIADATGLAEDAVKVTLHRHKDRFTAVGELDMQTGRGTRKAKLWGRAARHEEVAF